MSNESQQWDYSIFWQEALNQLRALVSEQEYVMWIRTLQYFDSRENELILSVPSSFYRDQVIQRYLKIIKDTLFDLSGMMIEVSFEIVKMQPPVDSSDTSSSVNPHSHDSIPSEQHEEAESPSQPAPSGTTSETTSKATTRKPTKETPKDIEQPSTFREAEKPGTTGKIGKNETGKKPGKSPEKPMR